MDQKQQRKQITSRLQSSRIELIIPEDTPLIYRCRNCLLRTCLLPERAGTQNIKEMNWVSRFLIMAFKMQPAPGTREG